MPVVTRTQAKKMAVANASKQFYIDCVNHVRVNASAVGTPAKILSIIDMYKQVNAQLVDVYRQNPNKWGSFVLEIRDKAIELLGALTTVEKEPKLSQIMDVNVINQCKTELTTTKTTTTSLIATLLKRG